MALTAQAADIDALVKEDLKNEVRPGGVNGSPFWNGNSRFFMYPPAFDFPSDARAVRYRFDIVDANGKCHFFDAPRPTASLAPVWEKLPTGWTSVSCRSVDKREERHMLKGCRVFWKQAPFTGNYPLAARGYRECADLAMGWIFQRPSWRKFMSTRDAANCGYWGFRYPTKMVAALVSALCGGTADEERIAAARLCADWLISISEGPDRPLAYFPPTYHCGDPAKAEGVVKEYWGQVMLIYPAAFGTALMKLYAVTKDEKYLAQAKGIAETYLKLQGDDGTWFLKMDTKTGKEVKPNRLMPIASVMPFLNTLYAATGDNRYLAAADRAFAYVENGPMRTWNWEGQFEDVGPDGAYRNLTKHDACATAIYICERYPNDRARLADARDLLRFSEDQFVCWERPFPDYPFAHDTQNVAKWMLPGVMEQYYWYVPIDSSASKLIRTYLALYRTEGNPLDLAKAKALGDAMTRMQKPDGDIPTHWHGDESGCSWWNCLLSDVDAMNELAAVGSGSAQYDVAAYVWPAYQPEPRWAELGIFKDGRGEWQNVYEAKAKWEGHDQPRKPLWGYENEADPKVVEKKIDAAVSHGVNVFIYDWYWYEGRPFLEDGINKGFLGAKNNGKMKFFIMWANHNVGKLWDNTAADKEWEKPIWRGGVSEPEFRKLVRRWIAQYFKRPNYYRIDGKPVLMIYEIKTFVDGVGGLDAAARSVAYLRSECVAAGLGGVHLMACDYGVTAEQVKALGIDSASIYNFLHWSKPFGRPDYSDWAKKGAERYDVAKRELGVPSYFAHVSVGWDTNPRFPQDKPTDIVRNSTPEKFAAALRRAKDWCDRNPAVGGTRLITVNSWNEWTEGSYLEPDERNGFGFLEAVKGVFCK